MNYRTIVGTDLTVAAICMGSTGIGSTIDHEMSYQLLDLYVDGGGNIIDTAAVYANWLPGEKNVSEKTIGRWLKSRSNRERIILSSQLNFLARGA